MAAERRARGDSEMTMTGRGLSVMEGQLAGDATLGLGRGSLEQAPPPAR